MMKKFFLLLSLALFASTALASSIPVGPFLKGQQAGHELWVCRISPCQLPEYWHQAIAVNTAISLTSGLDSLGTVTAISNIDCRQQALLTTTTAFYPVCEENGQWYWAIYDDNSGELVASDRRVGEAEVFPVMANQLLPTGRRLEAIQADYAWRHEHDPLDDLPNPNYTGAKPIAFVVVRSADYPDSTWNVNGLGWPINNFRRMIEDQTFLDPSPLGHFLNRTLTSYLSTNSLGLTSVYLDTSRWDYQLSGILNQVNENGFVLARTINLPIDSLRQLPISEIWVNYIRPTLINGGADASLDPNRPLGIVFLGDLTEEMEGNQHTSLFPGAQRNGGLFWAMSNFQEDVAGLGMIISGFLLAGPAVPDGVNSFNYVDRYNPVSLGWLYRNGWTTPPVIAPDRYYLNWLTEVVSHEAIGDTGSWSMSVGQVHWIPNPETQNSTSPEGICCEWVASGDMYGDLFVDQRGLTWWLHPDCPS